MSVNLDESRILTKEGETVFRIALFSPHVKAAMNMWQRGELTWEQALVCAVEALHKENETLADALKKQLTTGGGNVFVLQENHRAVSSDIGTVIEPVNPVAAVMRTRDELCVCDAATPCPLGKHGTALRCTTAEVQAHNLSKAPRGDSDSMQALRDGARKLVAQESTLLRQAAAQLLRTPAIGQAEVMYPCGCNFSTGKSSLCNEHSYQQFRDGEIFFDHAKRRVVSAQEAEACGMVNVADYYEAATLPPEPSREMLVIVPAVTQDEAILRLCELGDEGFLPADWKLVRANRRTVLGSPHTQTWLCAVWSSEFDPVLPGDIIPTLDAWGRRLLATRPREEAKDFVIGLAGQVTEVKVTGNGIEIGEITIGPTAEIERMTALFADNTVGKTFLHTELASQGDVVPIARIILGCEPKDSYCQACGGEKGTHKIGCKA